MPDLYVGTLYVVPVIVALIELFKRLGLPTAYAPWVNVLLYLIFLGVIGLVGIYPDLLQPATFAINVLIGLLTATGFYNRARATAQWLARK